MTVAFIAIVALVLLVVGTLIALAWWMLARHAAPYKDELDAARAAPKDDPNVVVIDPRGRPVDGKR